ncbi:dynein axonemal intermediate chain 3 isoform X1 [Gallus gallus]|uniref:dynein axonemal intermediate chain 3 isoform X1 n=1 Tax=Gallus gallus TaxID=9031 RepID=UPI001AE881C5|nr:dynein axonemal intermediate chain 3 isoform X1 [Gallus gallus]XP_046778985.1 dynein axonemal intermediate chain 3 isoform X1 [Gallus gallus]XP_046778986.1 dynein axonemal intermediate chain 3 isoform X1 [Gallus gallus]XP_046778987.1 dynein axonemal intermediate chain 3 isoform X1 [Gallus gallus]
MPKNLRSGKTTLKSPKTSAKKQRGEKAKRASKGKQKQPEEKDEVDLSMVGIGHPEIFPLVLTTRTQEIFNCRVDEDVTEENCFKLIKKDDIIQDLKTRAAISDFHPVKNIVLEYPGEELLIVFDANFQYGQNFYLVASEEAKENFLKPPETAEEIDSEEEKEETQDVCAYKPPVSKPWVSLGSEKEVEEESVKDRVKKIKYMFSRGYGKFGAPITLTDRNASHVKDSYVECTSYQDKTFSIKVLEKDVGVQMVPKVREASTQTEWTYPKNAATQYFPRQLPNEKKEEILSCETLKQFLTSACLRMEIALQQNEIMNAFSDDWKALEDDISGSGGKSDVCLKAYQIFTDLHYLKDKSISCVCWHPTIYGIIAVSATKRPSKEERTKVQHDSVIIFWSFFDPIHPQLILECPDDIYCFQFSPSNPNIIAGGCFSGQVVLWDISQYEEKLQNAKSVVVGMKKTVNMNNVSVLSLLEDDDMSELLFMEDDESDKGQILVRFCTSSSIHHSHEKKITDIHWLPDYFEVNRMGETFENRAGICVQLVTCSPDSVILFWDIRDTNLPTQHLSEKVKEENSFNMLPDVSNTSNDPDLIWKPLMKISLCDKEEENVKCSPTKISLQEQHYDYKITDKEQAQHKSQVLVKESPYAQMSGSSNKTLYVLQNISNNFFVGTEDGEIIYSDWEMKTKSNEEKIGKKYTIHKEAVNTVQRSPFFKDIILSVGGWNFAIWKENVTNGPILQSNCAAQRYTAGHWSLTRPGVFYIATDDGNIDIWDLLKETHKPSHIQNISKSAITCISPWIASSKQQFLAVSDDSGVLHVLEIRRTLSHPSSNESVQMNLRLMGHIVQRSLTRKVALPSSHKRYLKET